MPKQTVNVTFHTRAPYTLTRDVRLYDGTLVEGVKIRVEHIYKHGRATSPNREYSIEAFCFDVPNEIELEQEQLDELFNVLDNFVLRVESFLDGNPSPSPEYHTPNHVIPRSSKVIRPGQQISL